MGSRLYVGNLSYSTTEESLRAAFSPYGQVTSANIMIDRMSGRSRGFGFVEFSSDEESKKAIAALNGADLDGRSLTVNEARAREEGGNRTGNGGFRPHRGPTADRGWDNAPPRDFSGGGFNDGSGGASGGASGGRGSGRGGRRNDRDRRRNNDNDW